MKVLLSGASGFIGKALAKRLLLAGHELAVLTRNKQRFARAFPYPCRIFQWPAGEATIESEAFEGIEAVIHLAGERVVGDRWNAAKRKQIYDSRVLSTRNLLRALSQHKNHSAKVFISASAIGYYGFAADAERILTEKSEPGPGFLATVCRDWEEEALAAEEQGLRAVSLRIGMVLGRGGGVLGRLESIFRAGLGGKLGSGKQWVSWIHLADLNSIILQALNDAKLKGPLNLVSQNPVRNAEFTAELARALYRPAFLPVPGWCLKLIFGEMASVFLGSQRVMPEKLAAHSFPFAHPSLRQALEDLYPSTDPIACADQLFLADQWVQRPVEEVFSFFAEARNLEKITPPWLKFKLQGKPSEAMQQGTTIDFKLKIHGLPLRWQSSIEEWTPNESFVDLQLKGPYDKWHHRHSFRELNGGGVN